MSEEIKGKELPLEWIVPPDIQTKYSNNFVIQNSGDEFIISFFEVYPPILIGDSKMIEEKVTQMHNIPAKCVARIVLSRTNMDSFISLLQSHFEKP